MWTARCTATVRRLQVRCAGRGDRGRLPRRPVRFVHGWAAVALQTLAKVKAARAAAARAVVATEEAKAAVAMAVVVRAAATVVEVHGGGEGEWW